MPLIQLNDVTYTAPDSDAVILDNISLTVRPNETLAILGPSGCGKSTLIRIIAGLIKPSSGTVTYNDIPIEEVPMRERRIGMIFQSQQALYRNMTGEGNIAFYHELRHQLEQVPQRIKDVSKWMQVDLSPLLAKRPPKMSGGENQRIAIARALARDVDIFLFDEPLANLDAKLRTHLRIAMKRIFTHHPVTTLYVTHEIAEATTLGDRTAVMNAGKIVQVAPAAELLYRPRDMFVADFLGHCNFFDGTVREDGMWSSGLLTVEAPPKVHAGDKITLGFRPNDIELNENGWFEIYIQLKTPHYERRVMEINGRLEGVPVIIDLPIETEIEDRFRITPTRVHWFDTKTGLRLKF